MRFKLKALLVGVGAMLVLSSCNMTVTGYGKVNTNGLIRFGTVKLGNSTTPASLTYNLSCGTRAGGSSPFAGRGNFAYLDPAAGISIRGINVTDCDLDEEFPDGEYGIFEGQYVSKYGHGSYFLVVGNPFNMPLNTFNGTLSSNNVYFYMELHGWGPENGYGIESTLTGKGKLAFAP